MLPADLIGTLIYNQKTGGFETKQGPLFANIILADEINRSPAKVQSALLEAMQERQITIGEETFLLDDPFLVFATQNPIEQEGTYPLPEAQVDRFMMKLKVDYPSKDEELEILRKVAVINSKTELVPVVNPSAIKKARLVVSEIYVDDVRYVGFDILRHRIIPTYEAEAEEVSSEDLIQRLFDTIEVP